MSELITIRVKSKTGIINEILVAEVLDIDGKPFIPQSDTEQLAQLYNHLSGRISALESILGGQFSGE